MKLSLWIRSLALLVVLLVAHLGLAQTTNTATPSPRRSAFAAKQLDRDADGRISLAEFYPTGPAPLHPRMKQVFESFDKDHGGSLSYEDAAKVVATVSSLQPKLTPDVDGTCQPIPIEVNAKSKRAIIRATVNGIEGRFLLDTGTSDTILDVEFARQAGVDFVEICMPVVGGNYGKKGDIISLVRVPDLEIAGTHFRNFHAVMQDQGARRSDFDGRLAGIMGANVLFAKPITLDYRRQLLSFAKNTAGTHDFTFNLAPDHGKTAALDAEVDGVKVILMLDSGAAIGDTLLINERYHAALRNLARDPQAREYQAREVRVASQLLLAGQRCLLRPFEEAVIGSFFFDRHVITVNLSAGKVLIKRNAGESQTTRASLSKSTHAEREPAATTPDHSFARPLF